MLSIANVHKNPNGCNMPVTFYTLQQGTDCATAYKIWQQNHEIALHTVNHQALYPDFNGMQQEMMGVKDWLNKTCNIPATEMVGFRCPYLVSNQETRQVEANAKLLYDSSMIEVFQNDSDVENKPGMRVWPFTMDHGIPINCNWNYPDGQCNGTTERYPGLWEVPLWEIQDDAGEHLYSMDVGTDPPGDIFTLLQNNFNMNYNNNRAPFGIFLHATWFDSAGANAAALNKFLDWAFAQPNVWGITTKDLIRWMQAPVPASQMNDWYKCKPVDLSNPLGVVKCQLYTVKPFDSSYSVATQFAVTVEDLLSSNPELGNGDSLVVGEQIKIPVWDATCVGDGIKNVTGPNQVAATVDNSTSAGAGDGLMGMTAPGFVGDQITSPPPATTPSTPPTTPSGTPPLATPPAGVVDYANPATGVNVTLTLAGRTELAFQTDLKTPFQMEVAKALGVPTAAVTVLSVDPLNTLAGRKRRALLQTGTGSPPSTTGDLPVVQVVVRVATADPAGLLANATASLPQGGAFDKNVLPNYQLQMTQAPVLTPFKDGSAYNPNAEQQPSSSSSGSGGSSTSGSSTSSGGSISSSSSDSGSSGLSTGAIVGIAVGAVAAVALAAILAVVIIRKKKAAKASSPVSSESSDKFSKGGYTDDMEAGSTSQY